MSQPNGNQQRSIQSSLKLVLGITVILSIMLRLTAPGYILFYLGIVLLLVVIVHTGVHLYSLRQIHPLRSAYIYLILLSHLAFFLAFVFQADGADGPQVRVPILFWTRLTWNSPWVATFNNIVNLSLLILLLSWVILAGISLFHQIKTKSQRQPSKSGV